MIETVVKKKQPKQNHIQNTLNIELEWPSEIGLAGHGIRTRGFKVQIPLGAWSVTGCPLGRKLTKPQ